MVQWTVKLMLSMVRLNPFACFERDINLYQRERVDGISRTPTSFRSSVHDGAQLFKILPLCGHTSRSRIILRW